MSWPDLNIKVKCQGHRSENVTSPCSLRLIISYCLLLWIHLTSHMLLLYLFMDFVYKFPISCWYLVLSFRYLWICVAFYWSVSSVIFVNENKNENGEKRENNEFVNEN